MPVEQYIYYESDNIENIFFLVKGSAGYVIPFKRNVVYIEIEQGNHFGEIDIVNAALTSNIGMDLLMNNILSCSHLLLRMFTVQAVKDCVLLIMPLDCLHKMHRHFTL